MSDDNKNEDMNMEEIETAVKAPKAAKTDAGSKKDNKKDNKNFVFEKLTELRAEFRKIVWPSRDLLVKHTITTVVVSLLFGVFIAFLDIVIGFAFTSFVGMIN